MYLTLDVKHIDLTEGDKDNITVIFTGDGFNMIINWDELPPVNGDFINLQDGNIILELPRSMSLENEYEQYLIRRPCAVCRSIDRRKEEFYYSANINHPMYDNYEAELMDELEEIRDNECTC